MDAPALYDRFFVSKDDERVNLFRLLASEFSVASAIYPGSFVHIAPSFVLPEVVYVDMDRRCPKFFADPKLAGYIESRKEYAASASFRFHHQSYEEPIDEHTGHFDLLISQYAGLVSATCKQHLKPDGLLLVNDSHGDATLANLDPGFKLIAAINRRGERFSISKRSPGEYFVPKGDVDITIEKVRERGRGFGYVQTASSYVFQRVA